MQQNEESSSSFSRQSLQIMVDVIYASWYLSTGCGISFCPKHLKLASRQQASRQLRQAICSMHQFVARDTLIAVPYVWPWLADAHHAWGCSNIMLQKDTMHLKKRNMHKFVAWDTLSDPDWPCLGLLTYHVSARQMLISDGEVSVTQIVVKLLWRVIQFLQVTGNTYLKDNISQYIRMQNNQMIICEEISAPPVDLTDIFATRVYATTSTSVWFQSSPLCYNGWTPTSWDELAGKLVELFQRLLWLSFRMDQALISH